MFISYGPQSNDSLLQYYGFVEPDIPHDTYIVPDLAAAVPDAVSSSSPPSIKVCSLLPFLGLSSCCHALHFIATMLQKLAHREEQVSAHAGSFDQERP